MLLGSYFSINHPQWLCIFIIVNTSCTCNCRTQPMNSRIWGIFQSQYLCGLVVRVSGYRYRGPGFDPRRYQIFWVVVGLERGQLSLVRSNWGATWIKKSSSSRFRKQRLTAVGNRCANHVTPLYPQKLAPTSPTGGGRSVGMVRSRTRATEFSLVLFHFLADHLAIFTSVYGIQVIYVAQLATVNHKLWLLQSRFQDVNSKPRASHSVNSWAGYCPN